MDKIARIRQKIKELQDEFISIQPKDCSLELVKSYAGYAYLDKLLSFLDTLSEEPDKSLEEEIQRLVADYSEKVQGGKVLNPSGIEKIARYFAQWGAKHLRGSTKMIDKSLEEAAEAYQQQVIKETKNHIHLPQHTYAEGFEDALHLISDAFIAGFEYRSECEESSIMGDLLKIILKVGVQHNFGFGPDLKQCKDNEDESK